MAVLKSIACIPAPRAAIARRRFLTGALAAAGLAALPRAAPAQLAPEPLIAAASPLQRAILAAAGAGRPFRLAPGVTRTAGLVLPDGTRLLGAAGGSMLRLAGPGPLVSAARGARISLEGVTLEGGGAHLPEGAGLADFRDIAELSLAGCTLQNTGGVALRLERCGGRVRHCAITGARAGLFSLDAAGLVIDANSVSRCADNGVQIWRSGQGFDGTSVTGNRITAIGAVSGGTGQYGNGVSVYRAGGVTASGNTIRDTAFSALRNNSGHAVSFVENDCANCGETAIFAEFAFRDAVIKGNRIDGARSGIQMVNFADAGGRGALCTGNRIAGLHATKDGAGKQWGYGAAVKAEADALIAGNTVAGAPWIGVMAGWGESLSDVRVESNMIGPARIGIGVSVAPGAGRASVVGNTITGASEAALAAMLWDKIESADLAADAGRRWPLVTAAANKAA